MSITKVGKQLIQICGGDVCEKYPWNDMSPLFKYIEKEIRRPCLSSIS